MNFSALGARLVKWAHKPRILKTGLAVWITAALCQWLGWPVIFAVITAIVSIEPSVRASLQKGKIRLPAALVGAFFAMLFEALFGQSPFTYALSAMLTIYVCHLLRWNDAMIVATLTAVNMLTISEGHFMTHFFVRLGTTTVGLLVSVVVNFTVLPPRFSEQIKEASRALARECAELIHQALDFHMKQPSGLVKLHKPWNKLTHRFNETFRLIEFQKEEHRYRRRRQSWIELAKEQKKLELLRDLHFRINAVISLQAGNERLSEQEQAVIDHVRKLLYEQLGTLFDELEQQQEREECGQPQKGEQELAHLRDLLLELRNLERPSERPPESSVQWHFRDRLGYELWAIYELLKKIKCSPSFRK